MKNEKKMLEALNSDKSVRNKIVVTYLDVERRRRTSPVEMSLNEAIGSLPDDESLPLVIWAVNDSHEGRYFKRENGKFQESDIAEKFLNRTKIKDLVINDLGVGLSCYDDPEIEDIAEFLHYFPILHGQHPHSDYYIIFCLMLRKFSHEECDYVIKKYNLMTPEEFFIWWTFLNDVIKKNLKPNGMLVFNLNFRIPSETTRLVY